MSILDNIYTGALHPKRKGELEEIAFRLSLTVPAGALRGDIEKLISKEIRSNSSVRTSPTFEGLWRALPENRVASKPDTADSEADSSDDPDTDSFAGGTGKPSSSARGSVASSSATKLGSHVLSPSSTGSGGGSARKGRSAAGKTRAAELGGNGTIALLRKSRSTLDLTREVAVRAKDEAVKVVGGAQERLSDAWIVTTAIAAAELGYITWSAVPWIHVPFGPHAWYLRSPTPSFSLSLPTLSVLIHPTFTSPLISWTLLSVLLPLSLSLLVAFPTASPRRRQSSEIAPPNPVVFNIFRLASAVLVHYIFEKSGKGVGWSFEQVEGYPAVQILGAAVAGLLTGYQEVSGR